MCRQIISLKNLLLPSPKFSPNPLLPRLLGPESGQYFCFLLSPSQKQVSRKKPASIDLVSDSEGEGFEEEGIREIDSTDFDTSVKVEKPIHNSKKRPRAASGPSRGIDLLIQSKVKRSALRLSC